MNNALRNALCLAAGALLLPLGAAADYPRYTLDGQYVDYSGDLDSSGYRVNLDVDLTPNWFAFANHRRLEGDSDFERNTSSLGGGYRAWLTSTTSVFAAVSGEHVQVKSGGDTDSDFGYGLRGGADHWLTEQIGVGLSARYLDFGDDDLFGYNARAWFQAARQTQFSIEVDVEDGDVGVIVGGRLSNR